MMNEIIKQCLIERAFKRNDEKIICFVENPFHEYVIPMGDSWPEEIFFALYYHVKGNKSTFTETIRVSKDRYKSFCWDNEFYRNKIRCYLANDPRNWPDYPTLDVFNIYTGAQGVIHSLSCWKSMVIVKFENSDMCYNGAIEAIAHGWRVVEETRKQKGGKEWASGQVFSSVVL